MGQGRSELEIGPSRHENTSNVIAEVGMQRHLFPETGFMMHRSGQDASVNWDRPADVGRIEARYVRRCPDYFVVYLSSQTGCAQGCRMCHLTATGQTRLRDVTIPEMLEQARTVLDYSRQEAAPARSVHFNFMARGEPLANKLLLADADGLLSELSLLAVALGLRPRHLISTIYPRELGDRPLEDVFVMYHPDIHYSIYSMSDRFRRRWLPKALPAEAALDRLLSWQRSTGKIVTLHHAYIAGENDAEGDVHAVCDALEERRLMVHVNIVRYNPFDPARHGVEPTEEIIERNAAIYRERLPNARVSIIGRVGFDVAASCGMFFGPGGREAAAVPPDREFGPEHAPATHGGEPRP
jgi:adenine C2-methylase RlmN of 23S rRNA A2503 and tRNA A37